MIAHTLGDWMLVIKFCAEEVRRQYYYETGEKAKKGPLAVGWMLDAWRVALNHEGPITLDLIEEIGRAVEPDYNYLGLRRVGVMVGGRICPDPREVPPLLLRLIEYGPDDPGEWYKEYEYIHPFRDGNGRSGKVLFNLLNGTLEKPVFPPNFFGDIINP